MKTKLMAVLSVIWFCGCAANHGREGSVSSVQFSPDGTRLIMSTSNNAVLLRDAQTGQPAAARFDAMLQGNPTNRHPMRIVLAAPFLGEISSDRPA